MDASPVPSPRRARVRVGAGAALILVLLGLGVAVLVTAITPHGTTSVVAPGDGGGTQPGAATSDGPSGSTAASDGAASGSAAIYVHILGQVAQPGLYELRDGDRAVDVVAAAGGFTDQADPAGLNLARFLSDGEQIVVPALGEAPMSGPGAGTGTGAAGVGADGKVNINTADAATLDTLPRIGPAMAERIIVWRDTNGRFTAVEDLLDVTGIGDATLAGLRDLVTV